MQGLALNIPGKKKKVYFECNFNSFSLAIHAELESTFWKKGVQDKYKGWIESTGFKNYRTKAMHQNL